MSETLRASASDKAGEAARSFHAWGALFRRHGSVFQAELADLCAGDDEILKLASEVQPGQPASLMFFTAVNAVLLDDPGDPFASYFGYGDTPRALRADAGALSALKDFCRRRHSELLALLRGRTMQFTAVSRASFVPPLFGHILSKGAQEPFSLVEVGCSAGLLTVFDHYFFDYGPLGRLGDPANTEVEVPTFEGTQPPIPAHMPKISERFGVDLNPIDPADPVERRWIEAVIGPERPDERLAIRKALEVRAGLPLNVIKGDAMKVVPELLPKLKDTACILHANCLYQWSPAAQAAFHQMLLEASRERVIYRLGSDMLHDLPGRPERTVRDPSDELVTDLVAVTYRDGRAQWDYLGVCDGIGRHARWAA